MYCSNCGAENNDNASYCVKCGCRLNAGNLVKDKHKRNKSGKIYMVLTALVLVVTIVIASVFDLWPWSHETFDDVKRMTDDNVFEKDTQKDTLSTSTDGGDANDTFSLDAIVEECPDCQAAIETYIEMIRLGHDITATKEEFEELENLKCSQMQHFCTAHTIYVENVPYVFRGGSGIYTGDWVGAGPSGKGTYIGNVYGKVVTYTGDWGFGVPNGEGELYAESGYLRGWDMIYSGEFRNGKRDGTGSWQEYYADSEKVVNPQPVLRIYDQAVYSNDMLTDWIDCVDYDANTGEILHYSKMMTNEKGEPIMGTTWGKNDLSPEDQKVVDAIGTAIICGTLIYIVGEGVRSVTDPHYADSIYKGQTPEEANAELQQYWAKKDAEDIERQLKQKKDDLAARADDELSRLEAQGIYSGDEYAGWNRQFYENAEEW